ncbi:MAG: DUF4338 domain-containing protein [Proteobacteria bacterium]|nr:DUF4338 domain-containing protein [Pseudomonadota bacterium]
METLITYRGKAATPQDVAFIKRLIAENPDASRRALSIKLCKAWNWVQPNGALRDMVCRGFMLALHRAGYIQLPDKKWTPANPFLNRKKPARIKVDQALLTTSLQKIVPLEIRQVRRCSREKLFNSLMDEHHYLGYTQPVGEHLKYIVYAGKRPVACLAWSSAPRHIGCRDRFIGWSRPVREKNLHLLAYNNRFLILPWCRVPFLASHILGRIDKILPGDWQALYNHRIFFLETFIDTERYAGTIYRAANWIYLGATTGRGKNDQTNRQTRSIKAVWGRPLSKNFRGHLLGGGL